MVGERTIWKGTAPERGLSRSVQDRDATCQLQPPLCAAGFRVAHAGAPMCSLSLGRRRSTRTCPVPHGLSSLYELWKGNAPASGLSPSVRDRGATCELRPPLCALAFCVTRASAPLSSLSLGKGRSSADPGRSIRYGRALHRREASFCLCNTIVRCASCGLLFAQLAFGWHARAPLRSLSLRGRRSTRGCRARAALWSLHEL